MTRVVKQVLWIAAAVMLLAPAAAMAQEGQIAGTARDASGGVMPGVVVEVTSPALIEKVRSATTDGSGQYRITNLPVGTYRVTFALVGFQTQQRDEVVVSTGFTANINATMTIGQLTDTVVVTATTPVVDVQNARQATVFTGEDLRDLPTSRNVNSLMALTPGISSGYRPSNAFGAPGTCNGGVGVFCNPGVTGFNVGDTDNTNLQQGRVMVDGQVINSGVAGLITGGSGGYTADIANAQEVNIQISGALGDSETGGASINIVPRTGGNRFAGNYSTTYTRESWFAANNGNFPTLPAVLQRIISDHDVSGAFGGPIMRDRLWFFSVARTQGIHKIPVGTDFWPNLNEGKWGYNYQPDRSKDRVEYKNKWANLNARLTWQATQKNKFNIFWDEQDFCQDPCYGVVSVYTSPESWWSVQAKPNRLQQVSWTNPVTNKLLLEGGLTVTAQHYDTTMHREYRNPIELPRVIEVGDTAGADSTAPRVNQFAGGTFFALTSGSLNSQIGGGGAELRDLDNYRTRLSVSYVTGSHNAKIGFDGAYYSQNQTNKVNNPRLTYNYTWPAATCDPTIGGCGNTSLQFPEDPNNIGRRPVPLTIEFNTGSGTLQDRVMYNAFYAQDQWTMRQLTVSGALRFDHASSSYGETCVGPDIYTPVQVGGQYAGQRGYCVPPSDGVNFKNISPRWGAVWDIFGTGRTSIKYNMGKFVNAAGINGIYSGANPARRTVNILRRNWNDADGDRIADCDLMNFQPNGECGTFTGGNTSDTARFGRDPLSLDAAGTPIGLATTQCGRTEQGIPAAVQAYCAQYGDSLLQGWDRRPSEWQFGIGVQHEILPRLSGEFTYNRRMYNNLTVSDQLGIGCDRFNGPQSVADCQEGYLNYTSRTDDFFSVVAPTDPRLPNGGGYRMIGLATGKLTLPTGVPTAQTQMAELEYAWNGFDTNFVWRGPAGIRINGGTSTGRTRRDTCNTMLDGPNVAGREGDPYKSGGAGPGTSSGCIDETPFQTRINGTAAYVIPWVDVLVSTVFQSFPGVERSANLTYSKDAVVWDAASASRAIEPCSVATNGVGCLGATRNTTTIAVNLLNNNEVFGERVTMFDVKLAKNIRFGNKRATVGVDIYNVFNSDGIQGYNDTYTLDNPATPAIEENTWGQPTSLVNPRFTRISFQFFF